MKLGGISFIISLLILSASAFSADIDKKDTSSQDEVSKNFKGELILKIHGVTYTIKDLPKFENYPAEAKVIGKVASDIDWASDKNAWTYRTRLREGLKKGANFNGHYAVIMHGCGSPCQVNWIVDVVDGKVVGRITSSLGTQYNLDSSLISADLENNERIGAEIEAEAVYLQYIRFYKVEKDKLLPVKKVDLYNEIEQLKAKNSLGMDAYLIIKTLHIISSTILFGTGIGTAFFMLRSYFTQNIQEKWYAAKNTVLADYFFTLPAVIVQPITGVALIHMVGYAWNDLWLSLTYIIYVIAAVCWLPVVWIQIQLKNMVAESLKDGTELPQRYYRLFKIWFLLGWPAFIGLVVVFFLMVAKPV